MNLTKYIKGLWGCKSHSKYAEPCKLFINVAEAWLPMDQWLTKKYKCLK